jgi:hypothetical protein
VAALFGRVIGLVFALIARTALFWYDRHTEAPVMHERINKASDRFFAEEEERRGPGIEIDREDLPFHDLNDP